LYDENDQSYISTGLSELQDSNSLLEYIEKKFKNIMLNYHYRSTKRELIEFSNICFYDGNLVVANSPTEKKVGIEVIEVEKGL
jgi:superfamily I DNA and/or RNA helicase